MVTYGARPQRAASPIWLLLKPLCEALHVVHGEALHFGAGQIPEHLRRWSRVVEAGHCLHDFFGTDLAHRGEDRET